MLTTQSIAAALPRRQPDHAARRLLMHGLRRTGMHGLDDAMTASIFMSAFGGRYRRPLVLLRSLMAELSSLASGPIRISPPCCGRMTVDEALLADAIAAAATDPGRTRVLLGDVIGRRMVDGPAATAALLARAFADGGHPLD
ncbi:hypothetical protein NYR55_02155 [Sphingomonas sp. BGYR3]|uniref:DUF6628 family protein n=1 Tax=Sphingomonas sp. BGYR3 TaxID=2975483 RepID=UPI0021A88369|nr:DUF6628 family protein [Sphingomonas sp. BGYR3]MDG5487429.1 hypothetical protein [Sphingomonas sp. BGYR3]